MKVTLLICIFIGFIISLNFVKHLWTTRHQILDTGKRV